MTEHGSALADGERGLVLCLSGGGFRATFFHLGVIRYLRDSGKLGKVQYIYSVSGGSILAAHLALNWDQYRLEGADPGAFLARSAEVARFGLRDVRGRIVRRWIVLGFLPRYKKVVQLEREYRTLFGDSVLTSLPNEPHLEILASSLITGGLVSISSQGLWMERGPGRGQHSVALMPLAKAVAASSAFPPLFPPVKIDRADLRLGRIKCHWLNNSPMVVFDSLGPAAARSKLADRISDLQLVVSDAASELDWRPRRRWSLVTRNVRATEIMMRRIGQLQQEAYTAARDVVMLKIGATIERPNAAYDPCVQKIDIQRLVGRLRTDLDCFSMAEIRALVRHGYAVAREGLAEGRLRFGVADPCPESWPSGSVASMSLGADFERLRRGLHSAARELAALRRERDAATGKRYSDADESAHREDNRTRQSDIREARALIDCLKKEARGDCGSYRAQTPSRGGRWWRSCFIHLLRGCYRHWPGVT